MTLSIRDVGETDSWVGHWDPRWKLAAILYAVISTSLLSHWTPVLAALAVALLLAVGGRVPLSVILGRVAWLLLAVSPLLVLIPITASWFEALTLAGRIVAMGLFALVLTQTTPLPRTLAAARSLGFPRVVVLVAALALRYTSLLAAEYRRTRLALRARGFQIRTDRHSYQTLGSALGSLLVRSECRAETVRQAMECRGFEGSFRTTTVMQTHVRDVLGTLSLGLVMGTLVAIDKMT